MNKEQYILNLIQEECAEIAQRASKAMRFGLYETQDGQDLNNFERLEQEIIDLLAVIDLFNQDQDRNKQEILLGDCKKVDSWINIKQTKIKKYMEVSKNRGLLI